jgi:flagellar hook-associated protein 1 FlgK
VEEMTYNSHEISYRETVVQNAVRLTESVKTIATELVEYQKEINKDIEVTANQINGILDRIADLNKTIFNYEARGGAANDLRDQRNVLIDELSGYIDVEAYETSEGRMIINAGGTAIINDAYVRKIEVSPDQINPYTGEMLNSLHWEGTTAAVRPTAGTLKAMLDIRDGSSQEAQGIPYYLDQLNDLAASIVKEFNEINNTGWTIPYGSTDDTISRQGIDFFEEIGSNTTAALNMKVSEALLESGYNIALSSSELDSAMNWGNSENGLKFVALRDSNTLTYDGKFIGNFEEFFQKTVTDMAINKNYFDSRSASQQELTNFIESQRLAVSEVSIDEEMINLVQYQQAYNASAKLVQVVDEMLNTLMGIIR